MSVQARRDAAAQRTAARRRGKSATSLLLLPLALFFVSFAVGGALAKGPPGGGGGGGGGGGSCNKKTCDTTPPAVAISVPSSGAAATGTVTVAGTASDDGSVANVAVVVDGNAPQPADGTTSWTDALTTTAYTDGTHTITATATDSAGNVGSASISVDVSNSTTQTASTTSVGPFSDQILTNLAVSEQMILMGHGRMSRSGSLSVLLYREEFSWRGWARFRDAATGATSQVALPSDPVAGNNWSGAAYVLAGTTDLWVLCGNGPVVVKHYSLSGGPVPTSATWVSTQTFGNADSRPGDFTGLSSGGLVGVWSQQGALGPQGLGIAYRAPSGSWSTIYPLQFMQTRSSRQAIAQQPTDGSIWIFTDCDGCGEIGAVHLTEGSFGLVVDWTNETFINDYVYGENGPDPELPDLVAAPDPTTGTIALAYQSAHRLTFPCPGTVTGSYLAVVRVAPGGGKSFTVLPSYVERISYIGMVVRPTETWLVYRPIDATTCTVNHLYVSRNASGSWDTPLRLGDLYASSSVLGFGVGEANFAATLDDGKLHYFSS